MPRISACFLKGSPSLNFVIIQAFTSSDPMRSLASFIIGLSSSLPLGGPTAVSANDVSILIYIPSRCGNCLTMADLNA